MMSESWNSVLCLATVTLTVANRTRSQVGPRTALIFLPFENEALFCLFLFILFFFCLWSRWENTKTSCKHITLTTRRTSLSLSLSLSLSPPVLYSLEERAEAPSVTPYCGPLTCKGAMWSILMSINHYHDNSDKSVVRPRERQWASRVVAPKSDVQSRHCDPVFIERQSLAVLQLICRLKVPAGPAFLFCNQNLKWLKVECVIFGEFARQPLLTTPFLSLPVYYGGHLLLCRLIWGHERSP